MKSNNFLRDMSFFMCVLICTNINGQGNLKDKTIDSVMIFKNEKSKISNDVLQSDEIKEHYFTDQTSELIIELDTSINKIELRKIAKELGNRDINRTLLLTTNERKIIEKKVSHYIQLSKFKDANAYEEANRQIQGFWLLAVPVLIDSLESNDIAVAEFSAKSLILMRNNEIINIIIAKIDATQDVQKIARYLFVLSKMKEQRKSIVPGRTCMSQDKSEILFNELIKPVLLKNQNK